MNYNRFSFYKLDILKIQNGKAWAYSIKWNKGTFLRLTTIKRGSFVKFGKKLLPLPFNR